MRRAIAVLAVIATGAGVAAAPAEATARKFKNCTAARRVYHHGIAKNAAAARHASGLSGRPKISAAPYAANRRLDRDRDGVACEA